MEDVEAITPAEKKYIEKNRDDIVALAYSAMQIEESPKRINRIIERLRNKYGDKYGRNLPRWVILKELGFGDGVEEMAFSLYEAGLLTGPSYYEIAVDISRYRKLFDYGVELGIIE